jgi:hypothetical protein
VVAIGALTLACLQREGLMVAPDRARATGGTAGTRASGSGGAAGQNAGQGQGEGEGEGEGGEAGGSAGGADGTGGSQMAPADAGAPATDAGASASEEALARKASCPQDEDLRLCLRFEKTLEDESLPPAHLVGEPLVYEAGPTGMAVRAGAESLVRADKDLGTVGKDFTAEAWVRVDRFPEAGQRAGVIDKQLHFGLFILPGGDVACTAYGATATAKGALTQGQWAAAACRAQDGALTVWIDGVSRDQASFLIPLSLGPEKLSIGSNHPSGDPLYGLLDNVRVWTRARDAAEICAGALDCRQP